MNLEPQQPLDTHRIMRAFKTIRFWRTAALCALAASSMTIGLACVAGNPAGGGGGADDPGNNDPGNNDPGNNDPGNNDPGNNDPGNNDPIDPLLPPQCEPSEEVCDALDNDCDGEVDNGLACACTADTACYGGASQTRGVGACEDGSRACDGEFFGPCSGWVGPAEELCDDDLDNDCDGDTDEGACTEVCTIGDERACYEGDPVNAGVGVCTEGSQVCNNERRWGPCEGSVLPGEEICDDGLDNDCDGVEDLDCHDDLPDEEEVYQINEEIEEKPVDFVMAIDNSGSMEDTVAQVEDNLGDFATRLVDSGIDYRFVVVAARGTDRSDPDVCVPEPMAGSNCSNSARFYHASQEVDSHDAYERLIECLDGCGRNDRQSYGDFLREDALKQIIVVTDDESDTTWASFRDTYRGRIGDFILNGVVGLRSGGCVAGVGNRYIEGIEETGGEVLHICDNDWGEVIDVLFNATISRLNSIFELTKVPIPSTLRVFTTTGGPETPQIDNWIYNADANTVSFTDTSALAPGVAVIIRYKTL